MSMTGNAAGRSLGPGWRSGKGFQPPGPAVAAADPAPTPTSPTATSRHRSGSHATAGSEGSGGGWSEVVAGGGGGGAKSKGSNINHFAALDMDDEDRPVTSGTGSAAPNATNKTSNGGGAMSPSRRSEALRHSGSTSFGTGHGASGGSGPGTGPTGHGPTTKRSGRSLADLAASIGPSDQPRGRGTGPRSGSGSGSGTGRGPGGVGGLGGGGPGGGGGGDRDGSHHHHHTHHRPTKPIDYDLDKNIIRYTREKLLSLRPPVGGAGGTADLPDKLKHLEGVSVISEKANDPVCFDTFDPDEIWAQALKERRAAANVGGIKGGEGGGGAPPGPPRGFGGSRWERGVKIPPPDERRGGRSAPRDDTDNPDDLWDDPADGPTSAAMDFSAFGGSLDDAPRVGGSASSGLGSTGFDLSEMSEAAKRFEEELHGNKDATRRSSSGDLGGDDGQEDEDAHTRKIDSHRPLASSGTEIRSGSGDDVNVFEDFGDPTADNGAPAPAAAAETGGIEAGGEKSASSRLMDMIGVGGSGAAAPGGGGGGGAERAAAQEPAPAGAGGTIGGTTIGGVPLNPWGEPLPTQQPQAQGMDLAARLAEEQRAIQKQQEEEEARRRAEMERQQKEAAARQAQEQQQQQQQQQGPSQVELILMERVSAILENSWGRSDLVSILSTLHAEDSRVIPLLGNVDALRALIARHPRRVQLAKDPSFGAEMAVLLMSNAQWQQARAQEEQQRAQQEELQKRQQMMQQQMQQMAREPRPALIPNAPWFYTDPNGQVQGPFGGSEMRQWLEAGYFKGDLPISQDPNAPFRSLGHIFPDLERAFIVPEQPLAPEPPVPAMVEEVPVPMPSSPVRAPIEEPKPEVVHVAVPEPEPEPEPVPVAAPVAAAGPDQSSQLKAMLGLGGGSAVVAEQMDTPAESAPPVKEATTKKGKSRKEKATKGPKNAPEATSGSAKAAQDATASAPAAAWGGAAAGKPAGRKKSMSEIQQEEARVAARRARDQPNSGSGGGVGWANIAASGGTTAWSGDAVKPTPRAAPTAPQQRVAAKAPQAKPRQQAKAAAASQTNKSSNANTNTTTGDAFGESGKMSPELEKWCADQMKKISGSEDLTLVSFCMTLSDPIEIKQYLTAYLGSTPQVNNFASEFINRKDGKKAQQEQWESAGTGKKGRKKRGGKN